MEKCKGNSCEYRVANEHTPLTYRRRKQEIRYAQLWTEIELPKLLRGEKP